MTLAAILATGVACRAPTLQVGLVVCALSAPVACLALVLVLTARSAFIAARAAPVDPAVGTIVTVAGELSSGRPLRDVAADGHFGLGLASRARHGLDLGTASVGELHMFGTRATMIVATLAMAAESGAAVAHVFERLAADLIEDDRIRRDRRAAMAPAVAQAAVVGGIPLVGLAQLFASGRWLEMLSRGSVEASLLVVGTSSILAGVLWIYLLVRGRSRT